MINSHLFDTVANGTDRLIRETQNDRAVILWYNTGSEKEYLHG